MLTGSDYLPPSSTENDDSTEISVEPEDTSNGEVPSKKRRVIAERYTQVQLQLAIEAVRNGTTLYSACKLYGVPRPTLQYRLKNNITDLVVRMGPKCYLNNSQELTLVSHLHALADAGFTIAHKLIKTLATEYVRTNIEEFPKGNPFPAGIPSRNWTLHFLKRHLDLGNRMTENWSCYGMSSISPEHVHQWFGFTSRYLQSKGLHTVLQSCRQVFTLDDVNLKKGKTDVTFTCLFGANAYGNLLPPLVLYPDTIKVPTQKKQSELKYAVVQQDTELTAGNALYQWLSRVFEPWIIKENIPRPVILFVDGHRHQMGYLSSQFCQQNQIFVVSLLPRNAHMLRPLNIKLFESIKNLWCVEMKSFDKCKLSSIDPLLEPVLKKLTDCENVIRDGFYQSKMYPWSSESLDDMPDVVIQPVVVPKVRKNAKKSSPEPSVDTMSSKGRKKGVQPSTVDPMLNLFRRMLESRLSEQQLTDFQAQRHDEVWQGPVEQTCLFQMWRDLMNEIEMQGAEVGACFNEDPALEADASYFEPEVTVKQEDTGDYSLSFVKEETSIDSEDP